MWNAPRRTINLSLKSWFSWILCISSSNLPFTPTNSFVLLTFLPYSPLYLCLFLIFGYIMSLNVKKLKKYIALSILSVLKHFTFVLDLWILLFPDRFSLFKGGAYFLWMFCNLPFYERLSEHLHLISSSFFFFRTIRYISFKCYFFTILLQRLEIHLQFLLT